MYNRVMVVDDNSIDRYVTELSIKRTGFANEVIAIDSAQSALDYLTAPDNREVLPQIIFLDINMPEMNGFEFLDAYKGLPAEVRESCAVMMLSSSLDPRDVIKVKNNEHVAKFVNKPLIRSVLEQLLIEFPPEKELVG